MTHSAFMTSRLRLAVLGVGVLFAVSVVHALDYNDVKNLLRNQVAESVIINMAQQDATLAITNDQANELRAMGATEHLVSSIRRAVSAPPPAVVSTPVPQGTVGYPTSEGTYISANEVYGGYEYPQGTTTYVDPNVYYTPSYPVVVEQAPIIVEQAPTVIYETPTYVYPSSRPSWGFEINIGGGGRKHNRWGGRHGGRRPHRR